MVHYFVFGMRWHNSAHRPLLFGCSSAWIGILTLGHSDVLPAQGTAHGASDIHSLAQPIYCCDGCDHEGGGAKV